MSDILNVDVGGVVYKTTIDTLTRYPDSMLGAIFSDRLSQITDDKGCCFIDGDGALFRYVLNFLRRSELVLPEDFSELDMLLREANFYKIQPMVEEIKKILKHKSCRREFLEVEYDHAHNGRPITWRIFGEQRPINSLDERFRQQGIIGNHCCGAPDTSCRSHLEINGPQLTKVTISEADTHRSSRVKIWRNIADLGFTMVASSGVTGDASIGWIFERNNHESL